MAYAAATPLAKAMTKSKTPGLPRDFISSGRCSVTSVKYLAMRPKKRPMAKERRKPNTTEQAALRINRRLPWIKDSPAPTKAVISGATSIAPMTTAVESCNNPRPAINVDRQIRATKSKSH